MNLNELTSQQLDILRGLTEGTSVIELALRHHIPVRLLRQMIDDLAARFDCESENELAAATSLLELGGDSA